LRRERGQPPREPTKHSASDPSGCSVSARTGAGMIAAVVENPRWRSSTEAHVTGRFDWKLQIAQLVSIKQALADVDTEGLWENRLPRVAASEDELKAVENNLREALDPEYRAFLLHAAGWPAFWQTVDLFGPQELLGGGAFGYATEMLGYIEDAVLSQVGFDRAELLPIAASPNELDLFLMTRPSSRSPGHVVWLAGGEVDRFPSFQEYFMAMMDYNRLELRNLADDG
jgi:hypothetical protein